MRLIDAEQYRKEFLNSRDFEPMKILDFQPTIDAIPREQVIETIQNAEIDFSIESDIDLTKCKKEIQAIIDNILKAQIKAIMEL